jgi:hypothetical protein
LIDDLQANWKSSLLSLATTFPTRSFTITADIWEVALPIV